MPNPTNDNEAPTRPADEVKRDQTMEREFMKLISATMELLLMVEEEPDVWNWDIMKDVRDKSYKITGDPEIYQPSIEGGWGATPNQLTKEIGECLYDKGLPILQTGSNILLQITHAEFEWKSNQIDNCTVWCRQWKFSAVDGDGTAIPLRVDSTLNSAANLLTPGSIVLIESFIPIHFKYEDHADDRCVIEMEQFEVKGHHSFTEEILKRPTKRAKPSKKTKR